GSFDHLYPNEHSFVSVAFTLFEIALALRDLKNASIPIPSEQEKSWDRALRRGASFLLREDETHGFISNHRGGAACALYLMYLSTEEESYKDRAFHFIQTIREKQSSEGWYSEYGGADPGYQTLDTYYQANFYILSNDDETLKRLRSSIQFLIYFVHPDGSVGGEYGSRNCPLYFPSGFELLAPLIPEAETITRLGARGIESGATPDLNSMDIRNFVPMLSSYTQAFMVARKNAKRPPIEHVEPPFDRDFHLFWPEAQCFIHSKGGLYTVLGLSKGGVIKVFDVAQKCLVASMCGYFGRGSNKTHFSNQMLQRADLDEAEWEQGDPQERPPEEETTLRFSSSFFEVNMNRIMTPSRFFLFRLFNLTLGKFKFLNYWVRKNIIVGIFINRRVKIPLTLDRTIQLGNNKIEILDTIKKHNRGLAVKELAPIATFTTIYMGSSKYFRTQELNTFKYGGPLDLKDLNGAKQQVCLEFSIEKP
ncbi:MAG: hypothetical protein HOJ13_12540, partial [Nitrospina sp.]|nr:hypothetical protein [Nitrospina sp.]